VEEVLAVAAERVVDAGGVVGGWVFVFGGEVEGAWASE
jgi:hypothetical protein